MEVDNTEMLMLMAATEQNEAALRDYMNSTRGVALEAYKYAILAMDELKGIPKQKLSKPIRFELAPTHASMIFAAANITMSRIMANDVLEGDTK